MPSIPRRVSSTQTGVTTASVTVTWNAVIDTGGIPLTGYKVYTTLVSSGVMMLAYDGTNLPEIHSTTIINLVLNQQYEIQVSALNLVESVLSQPLTLIAAGLPNAPGAITEISNSRTGTSIGLQWVAPLNNGGSPILSFTLVEVIQNQPDTVLYFGTSMNTPITGLTSGVTYSFRVKATNLVGDSDWSSVFQFLIVDKPSQPLNPTIIDYESTYATLTWEQPLFNGGQTLSGFDVYSQDCSDSESVPTLIATLPPSQFEYTDNTVVGGTLYCYTITAFNVIGGQSDKSVSA